MTRKFEITDANSGAAFTVRVVTRASNVEISSVQDDGSLKVRLTESSDDGAANRQLIELLAHKLGVDPSNVEIVAGENSRDKLISVDGITPEDVERYLVP